MEKVNNTSLTSEKIADGAINGEKIANGQVVRSLNGLRDDLTLQEGINVSINASGNELTISSTNPGGDITAVNAGSGLVGGATSGEATLAIASGGVTTENISDGAITQQKIADHAVGFSQIADEAISGRKIANKQVVRSLNGLRESVTLREGGNVSISSFENELTISSSNPGGDITAVTAGTGLGGGGNEGNVTLQIANGGVGLDQLSRERSVCRDG